LGTSASRWVGMTGDGKGPADGVGGAWWCPGCRGGGRVVLGYSFARGVAVAGVDVAGDELGSGQPGVVGADQLGGGGVAGEAGGVGDQRACQGAGGHWSFTSVMAARTAVVSAMVLCVV